MKLSAMEFFVVTFYYPYGCLTDVLEERRKGLLISKQALNNSRRTFGRCLDPGARENRNRPGFYEVLARTFPSISVLDDKTSLGVS